MAEEGGRRDWERGFGGSRARSTVDELAFRLGKCTGRVEDP